MELSEVLDLIGSLVASLKLYASKLPAVVPLAAVPGGIKPSPEAVNAYEATIARFRAVSGATVYKKFHDPLIESLEAFESGRLLEAIHPVLAILDQLDTLTREKLVPATPADNQRVAEYRSTLQKILPGNTPELDDRGRKP